jgi:hypothetical protein
MDFDGLLLILSRGADRYTVHCTLSVQYIPGTVVSVVLQGKSDSWLYKSINKRILGVADGVS